MRVDDFDYFLPDDLIARHPPAARQDSRLLVLDVRDGSLAHRRIADFPGLLGPDDLLVLNDTRVIPARLFGRKDSGGRVEVLCERVEPGERTALAHVRASKSPKPGTRLLLDSGDELLMVARASELFELALAPGVAGDFLALLERAGRMPLPPYIDRPDAVADRERYQTVYARAPGAVAAPTAGLHFDEALLAAIASRGVRRATVTLHVGAGTFQPVRVDDIASHRMHAERVVVGEDVVAAVAETRARGGRVVAIGTTSVRSLEAAAQDGTLRPFRGETEIFIRPGYCFRVVDAMLTNFHLPRSTLLMLVSAFAGRDAVLAAYEAAIRERYRFFSYGDAMFIPFPQAGALAGRNAGATP